MNIFFLDKTPDGSAEMLCDKHVPKMLLESMKKKQIQRHLLNQYINQRTLIIQ